MEKDFLDDEHIIVTRDSALEKTLLPSKYSKSGFQVTLDKALEKYDGMKNNGRPDYIYGIQREMFPIPDEDALPPAVTTLLEIARGMHHPFLLIEGKAGQGSSAEAENQACRGGATLVNAARMLKAIVGLEQSTIGADPASFLFSVTMSPNTLDIWVHWCHFDGREERFHMNNVASWTLKRPNTLWEIRQMLHNILEWGANNRYAKRKALHDAIHRFAVTEAAKGKKRKRDDGSSIPSESEF